MGLVVRFRCLQQVSERVAPTAAAQPRLNISQHTYHHNKDNIAQHRVLGSVLGSGLAPGITEDALHTYIFAKSKAAAREYYDMSVSVQKTRC